MAINSVIYANEFGLPLNAVDWLIRHHMSKSLERQRMIHNLGICKGSFVVDAGCGPGLWIPLLADAVGEEGSVLGVDLSSEALIVAQRRCAHLLNRFSVHYKIGSLEALPIAAGNADLIFSANVSQYLVDPVATFMAMGSCLKPGGRMVIKDIDYGTISFSGIDAALQQRVFWARRFWEQKRVNLGFPYEDSWVGPKLPVWMRAAGFADVHEEQYRIVRQFPLSDDFRFYLQGLSEWFVSEEIPYLSGEDITRWLDCFFDPEKGVLDNPDFACAETEVVVSGTWPGTSRESGVIIRPFGGV